MPAFADAESAVVRAMLDNARLQLILDGRALSYETPEW